MRRNRITLTNDQCELVDHLLDMLDRGMESAPIHELFGLPPQADEWHTRMIEAMQHLSDDLEAR